MHSEEGKLLDLGLLPGTSAEALGSTCQPGFYPVSRGTSLRGKDADFDVQPAANLVDLFV